MKLALLVLAGVVASSVVVGQQQPAQGRQGAPGGGRGGIPPPINWPEPPLPNGPILVQSAVPAHRDLRIVVTKGLSHPWAMQFLPDGSILVTERAGRLRIIRNGVVDPTPIPGLPAVARRADISAGSLLNGKAGRCVTAAFSERSGSMWAMIALSAGFSPLRRPAALA